MKFLKKMLAAGCAVAMTFSLLSVEALAEEKTIALQVNGTYVEFTDAAPEAKSGRTFIPVRAAFNALGADVEWVQGTNKVIASKDGRTVEMSIGSKYVTVSENGEVYEIEMDVAPYTKNERTYVPVRFAAQAFDCAVGWDQDDYSVIIVDIAGLLGDATFDNINGWIAASAAQEQAENVKMTGDMSLDMTVPDYEGGYDTYPLDLEFMIHSTATKQQMELKTDFKDLAKLLLEGSDMTNAEMSEILKLCKAAAEIRMDVAAGDIYFTVDCPLLWQMSEEAIGNGDIWYFLNLDELMAQYDMEALDLEAYLTQIQAAEIKITTMEDLLYTMFSAVELTDVEYDYATMKMLADVYCALLSDQAMVKQGDQYKVTWEMEEDGASVALEMTYITKNGALVGADITVDMAENGEELYFMYMSVAETDNDATIQMEFSAEDVKLVFDMNYTVTEMKTEPEVLPPDGAEIVDIMQEIEKESGSVPVDDQIT